MAAKFLSKGTKKTFQINVDPKGNFVVLNSAGTQELFTGNVNEPASKIKLVDGAGPFLEGLNTRNLINDSLEVSKTIAPNVSQTTPPPPRRTQENPTGADPANDNPANQSPNSALEDLSKNFSNKPFENQSWLRYPLTMNSEQDRIIISQINFVAANMEKEAILGGSLQNRESQFAKQDSLGQVILPIPNELSEANSTGWGEDNLSTIAAALMKGGTAAASEFGEGNLIDASGEVKGTLATLLSSPGVGTRAKQFLATKAAATLIGKGGIQINPEAYITRATGSAINSNLELLFQGPKLRQFGFSFKMSPRNADEARNIRYIIKFFKKGMSPKRSTQSELSFFLGTPNIFKIEFKSSKRVDSKSSTIRSIGQIKTCALINFTVNYTPDGVYAAYEDSAAGGSQPVAVVMTLAFSELTPIFNDNYEDTDSVGPDNFDDIEFSPSSTPDTNDPPNTGAGPTAQQRGVAGEALLRSGAGATPAQTLIRPAN